MNFDFNNTLGVGLRVFALFLPIIVIYTSILTIASKKLNLLQKIGFILVKVISALGILFFLVNYVFVN